MAWGGNECKLGVPQTQYSHSSSRSNTPLLFWNHSIAHLSHQFTHFQNQHAGWNKLCEEAGIKYTGYLSEQRLFKSSPWLSHLPWEEQEQCSHAILFFSFREEENNFLVTSGNCFYIYLFRIACLAGIFKLLFPLPLFLPSLFSLATLEIIINIDSVDSFHPTVDKC